MKLNLNAKEEDLNSALQAYFLAVQQQPVQDIGEAIKVMVQNRAFSVIKNKDSFTVEGK